MKYWNKKKGREQFVKVKFQPWNHRHTHHDLTVWCKQQPSTGKFYHYFASDYWYFELPEDATYFMLKWS